MAFSINPVNDHREREKGVIVYPVYSRRSKGLSIGLNLFTGGKQCPFDCPYCEVFPFSSGAVFSLEQMEEDLRRAVSSALERGERIMDFCFSGNGEPTISPFFPEALKLAERLRDDLAAQAKIVLITNGAGLFDKKTFDLMAQAAVSAELDIWLKLDAGTRQWYQKINRSQIPFDGLISKIKEFASLAPVTTQTMLCAIDGEPPPREEAPAWEALALELAENAGGSFRKAQIYGKARPAPEDPLASALPVCYLEERAASLRRAFAEKGITAPVETHP